MSYRLSSKKRQARKNRIIKGIALVFLLVVAFFVFSYLSGPVSGISGSAVQAGKESRTLFGAIFTAEQKLIRDNEALQQRLNEETVDRQLFNEVVLKNQELTRILGRDINPDFILAGVVKKPPFSPYDIYTIDAGSENGVVVGNIVQFSDFVALGVVRAVNLTAAKVGLYSAPGEETTVSIAGETYVAEGKGGGTFTVRAARDAGVAVGDALLLPGYQTLSIGTVRDVLFDPQDGFVEVRATTPVNIQSVDLVRVSEIIDAANTDVIEFLDETTQDTDAE